jgi:hypothetical protein
MFEVRDNPEQLPYWQAIARSETPDWDAVFADYNASVDWPSARFWRELAAHFTDAKVLLSVRSPESWIKSVHATIWPSLRDREKQEPGTRRDRQNMSYELIVRQTFDERLDDPEHAMAVYRAHNEEVRREIPADRLLVYTVGDGWEPLCRFLNVDVPDTPYPHTNSTAEFRNLRRTGVLR